jgi:hypothetical protein
MVILSNTYPGGFKYAVASDAILKQESGRTRTIEEIEIQVGGLADVPRNGSTFKKDL